MLEATFRLPMLFCNCETLMRAYVNKSEMAAFGQDTVCLWIQTHAVPDNLLHARTLCFGAPDLVVSITAMRDKMFIDIFVEASWDTCVATRGILAEPPNSACIGCFESFVNQNRRTVDEKNVVKTKLDLWEHNKID